MGPIITADVSNQQLWALCLRRRNHLNGCSALKRFDMVGFEKGTLDSNLGEEPVDEVGGLGSAGLSPSCIYDGSLIGYR